MHDSDYVVVFDILKAGYHLWWIPIFGLLFIPFGLLILTVTESAKDKDYKVLKIILVVLCLLWSGGVFVATFHEYWKCSRAFALGKASYVEGTVENFVPMPHEGHANETFSVKGVSFALSDFGPRAGYYKTSSYGSPIHQGLPVRIWYVEDEIVKLEVARNSP